MSAVDYKTEKGITGIVDQMVKWMKALGSKRKLVFFLFKFVSDWWTEMFTGPMGEWINSNLYHGLNDIATRVVSMCHFLMQTF